MRACLSGTLHDALGVCGGGRMESIDLYDNQLSGTVPAEAIAKQQSLVRLKLGAKERGRSEDYPASLLQFLQAHGVPMECGNSELSVSAGGRALIIAAVQPHCTFLWPNVVQ